MPAARKGKVAKEKADTSEFINILNFLNWIKSGLCQERIRGK